MGTPIIGSTTRMTIVAAMMALEYTSPKESIQRFIFGLLACACGQGTVRTNNDEVTCCGAGKCCQQVQYC